MLLGCEDVDDARLPHTCHVNRHSKGKLTVAFAFASGDARRLKSSLKVNRPLAGRLIFPQLVILIQYVIVRPATVPCTNQYRTNAHATRMCNTSYHCALVTHNTIPASRHYARPAPTGCTLTTCSSLHTPTIWTGPRDP